MTTCFAFRCPSCDGPLDQVGPGRDEDTKTSASALLECEPCDTVYVAHTTIRPYRDRVNDPSPRQFGASYTR